MAMSKMQQQIMVENEQLKAQAARLRKRVNPGRAERIVTRAHDDARIILRYRMAGLEPSRRRVAGMGAMNENRYGWAYGLLRMAKLEDAQPETPPQMERAFVKLQRTCDALLAMPPDSAMGRMRAAAGKKYAANIYRKYR